MSSLYSNKGGYSKLTKDEADDILKGEMTMKEFWSNTDNSSVLQNVLDILFNYDGNIYEADFQESQTSTRLIINCLVCAKGLSSYDPFFSHHNGKAHKKAVTQERCKTSLSTSGPLIYLDMDYPKTIYKDGSLEQKLDMCEEDIMGIQFIYKWIIYKPKERYLYKCELCHTQGYNQDEMFLHIISKEHSWKYLLVKFEFTDRDLQANYKREMRRVIKREGKVNFNIPDFSKQLSEEPPYKPINKDIFVKGSQFGSTSTIVENTEEENESCETNCEGTQTDPNLFLKPFHPIHELSLMRHLEVRDNIIKLIMNDSEQQEMLIQGMAVYCNKLARHWTTKILPPDCPSQRFIDNKIYISKVTKDLSLMKAVKNKKQ